MALFNKRPPTGRNNAQTSYSAADVISGNAPTLRSQVLNYAASRRELGFTDEELADYFPGMTINSIRPRRVELKDAGLIVPTAQRRKNRAGNDCMVWMHISMAFGAKPVEPKRTYAQIVSENEVLKAANNVLQKRIDQLERQLERPYHRDNY